MEAQISADQQESQSRELASLDRVSGPPPITAMLYGRATLRTTHPTLFEEMVAQYSEWINLMMEERGYRVDNNVNEKLREMSERLGFLQAGPRDIVEIHTAAIKSHIEGLAPLKAKAAIEEARLMIVELMGYLTSFYRTYAMGRRITNHREGTHE
jgi:hypothetical protein